MINEESLRRAVIGPELATNRSSFANGLIRIRESILNRLSGAASLPVVNYVEAAQPMAPGADLPAKLKQALTELKVTVMDDSGGRVDYQALRRSPAYAAYQEECQPGLRSFKLEQLRGEQDRRAFWINLYNALVLDAVIAFGVNQSVTEGRLGILGFFRRAAYLVDGQRMSLEDIEHGILRGNRGHPYLPGVHFPSDDARLALALPVDPRIHFALNCGGLSCPPIRAYDPDKLDDQLDLAARSFVDATVQVSPERKEVSLSEIFKWYKGDFGGRQDLMDFLIKHLPDDERRDFLAQAGDKLRLSYAEYDWGLNGF